MSSKKIDFNLLWRTDIDDLKHIDLSITDIIFRFKEHGFDKDCHGNLIHSVFNIWKKAHNLSFKNNPVPYLYQYTTRAVLGSIIEKRNLRLTPASYQNDPEEGLVLIKYLQQLNSNEPEKPGIRNLLENIQNNTTYIAFIRSLTKTEDSLLMWNSSYAEDGGGISMGIDMRKLIKGVGILGKKNFKKINIPELGNAAPVSNDVKKDETNLSMPLEEMGLYRILYIDKNKSRGSGANEKMIGEIYQTLNLIPEEDMGKEKFPGLLADLFTLINHLIKDKSYQHEDEYRLMTIRSLQDTVI